MISFVKLLMLLAIAVAAVTAQGTGTGTGTPTPGTGTPTPGTGTPSPPGTPTPGTGTPTPGTGTPSPGTGTPSPGTGTPSPPGTPSPGTGTPSPGTGTGTGASLSSSQSGSGSSGSGQCDAACSQNGGSCVGGKCVCPNGNGYVGPNCEYCPGTLNPITGPCHQKAPQVISKCVWDKTVQAAVCTQPCTTDGSFFGYACTFDENTLVLEVKEPGVLPPVGLGSENANIDQTFVADLSGVDPAAFPVTVGVSGTNCATCVNPNDVPAPTRKRATDPIIPIEGAGMNYGVSDSNLAAITSFSDRQELQIAIAEPAGCDGECAAITQLVFYVYYGGTNEWVSVITLCPSGKSKECIRTLVLPNQVTFYTFQSSQYQVFRDTNIPHNNGPVGPNAPPGAGGPLGPGSNVPGPNPVPVPPTAGSGADGLLLSTTVLALAGAALFFW